MASTVSFLPQGTPDRHEYQYPYTPHHRCVRGSNGSGLLLGEVAKKAFLQSGAQSEPKAIPSPAPCEPTDLGKACKN